MMKRFFAAALTTTLLLVAAPAQAQDFYRTGCWQHDDSGAIVCVSFGGHIQNDGRGIKVETVKLHCSPLSHFEDGQAVDGEVVGLFNHKGDRVWSRGPEQSNIPGGSCQKTFSPGVFMAKADTASLGYVFWARLDNRPDPGWRTANTWIN